MRFKSWTVVLLVLCVVVALLPQAAVVAQERPDPTVRPEVGEWSEPIDVESDPVPEGANKVLGSSSTIAAEPAVLAATPMKGEAEKSGWTPIISRKSVEPAGGRLDTGGPVVLEVPESVIGPQARGEAAVQVLERGIAAQVSPVDAAFMLGFEDSRGLTVAAQKPYEVRVDVDDVPLPWGGDAVSRLVLYAYSGCEVRAGELSCESVHQLDTAIDPSGRLLSAVIDHDELARQREAQIKALMDAGATREEAERPVLPPFRGEMTELAGGAAGSGGFGLPGSTSIVAGLPLQAGGGAGSVVAVGTVAGGSQGNFGAADFAGLQDFQVGLFTGAAETGVPIALPSPAAGPSPSFGLSYSSGAVDGLHVNANNQGGPVGVGWSMTAPAITRSMTGGCVPSDPSGAGGSGSDQCYTEFFSMQTDGASGRLELVTESASFNGESGLTEYRLVSAPGWRVFHRLDGVSNGDVENEWWMAVDTSGTVYRFGQTAQATDWVPMYFDSGVGLPAASCDYPVGYSLCTKAYKWNLETVVDLYGNEVNYRYEQEINWYYPRGAGIAYGDGGPRADYVRASRLVEIVYGGVPSRVGDEPNARLKLNWEWRCGNSHEFAVCAGAASETALAELFVDTPMDLACRRDTGTACANTQQASAFFTEMRLTSVQTQIQQHAGLLPPGNGNDYQWHTTATYDLEQGFPDPDSYESDWEHGFGAGQHVESEAKLALYRVTTRPGGSYEHYGFAPLEAEGFDRQSSGSVMSVVNDSEDIGGGGYVRTLTSDKSLYFDDVWLGDSQLSRPDKMYLRVSNKGNATTHIEIRINGQLAGTAQVPNTGAGTTGANGSVNLPEWTTVSANLSLIGGIPEFADVELRPKNAAGWEELSLNWVRFNAPEPGAIGGLAPVQFAELEGNPFAWLPNRVNSPTSQGVSPMVMPRIKTATNPLGGSVTFTYDQPAALRCGGSIWGTNDGIVPPGAAQPDNRDNRTLCYPGWDPGVGEGSEANPGWVYWHKWVVTAADWADTHGDNEPRRETYEYEQPRWGFAENLAAQADPHICGSLTWTSFRGFGTVTVTNHSTHTYMNTDSTNRDVYGKTRYRFFQGMYNDPNDYGPGNSLSCAPATRKTGGSHDVDMDYTLVGNQDTKDYFWRRGQIAWTEQLDDSDNVLTRTENYYRQINAHDNTDNPTQFWNPALTDGTAGSIYHRRFGFLLETRTRLYVGTGTKTTKVRYTYAAPVFSANQSLDYVRLYQVYDSADITTSADNLRVRTWYDGSGADLADNLTQNPRQSIADSGGSTPQLSRQNWVYNSKGFVTQSREYFESGSYNTTKVTPDTRGRPKTVEDPDGNITTTVYDGEHGSVKSITVPVLGTTNLHYDDLARNTKVVDPNGKETRAEYDDYDRVTATWASDNNSANPSTRNTYAPASAQPKWIKTESRFAGSNYLVSQSYVDGFGRTFQTDTASPEHNQNQYRVVQSVKYDGMGRPAISSTVPLKPAGNLANKPIGEGAINWEWITALNWQWTHYDALGRTIRNEQRTVQQNLFVPGTPNLVPPMWDSEVSYDLFTTTYTDPKGNQTEHTADAHGNLIRVDDANSVSTYYQHTPIGQLRSVSDTPNNLDANVGVTTVIDYDLAGRKESLDDPNTGMWTYEYNSRGLLESQHHAGTSQNLYFNYDDAARLTDVRNASATGPLLKQYTYDPTIGGTTWLGMPDTETSYQPADQKVHTRQATGFDDGYRQTSIQEEVFNPGSSTALGTWDTSYSFGDGGQLLGMTYATGETVNYTYNNVTGLLVSGNSPSGFSISTRRSDWAGRRTREDLGGTTDGIIRKFGYSADTGRMKWSQIGRQTPSPVYNGGQWWPDLFHNQYFYDLNANIKEIRDHRNPQAPNSGAQRLCYGYDSLDRLTSSFTGLSNAPNPVNCGNSANATVANAEPNTAYRMDWEYKDNGNIDAFTQDLPGTTQINRDYTYSAGPASRSHQHHRQRTGRELQLRIQPRREHGQTRDRQRPEPHIQRSPPNDRS